MTNSLDMNPGSFKDFAENMEMDLSSPDLFGNYSQALTAFRENLASQHGMTTEEFHAAIGRGLLISRE